MSAPGFKPGPSVEITLSSSDADSVPSVTAAVALLDGLDRRPVTEHVEVFAAVHARLQGALTEIDSTHR